MSMDPVTGHVKAYVGGPNFTFFQYDMVSTGRRQIGSTIKPFLYTYAMEEGYTPCDEFLNEQPTIYDEAGRPWSPRNAGSARVGEMVDIRWALTNSNNWISARLMSQKRKIGSSHVSLNMTRDRVHRHKSGAQEVLVVQNRVKRRHNRIDRSFI